MPQDCIQTTGFIFCFMGQDSSVGLETMLRDGGFGDRIPVEGQDFLYPA